MIDVGPDTRATRPATTRPGWRVLVLHSRYLSGTLSGENRVVEDEVELLRRAGHEVHVWTPSAEDVRGLGLIGAGVRVVSSAPAAERVIDLIERHRPDVVHLHNLFPMLSPAVIAAASRSVPVVVTLHNYRLLCLPGVFFRDGRGCEACLGRVPWRGVVHACYRGSTMASAALATSLTLHRRLGTFDRVARFLAVSEFVRRKHVEAGFPADRITVRPNFAWDAGLRGGPGEHFLFAGRLSPEKGVETLLRVWQAGWPSLLVAGDGPLRTDLERSAPEGVRFLGRVDPSEVGSLLGRARGLLLPARSFEAHPRVIAEAYARGVPVVGTRLGGVEEAVAHDDTGLLVGPDDLDGWTGAVSRLLDDGESKRLGLGARRLWKSRYSPERAIGSLESAYRSVVTMAGSS